MRFSILLPVAAVVAVAAALGKDDAPASFPPDPEIKKMLLEISAERIQRSVFVLASFKTRHSLSDPLPSGDGIGGAGAWIRAEFERVSAATGGRLRVDRDEFNQPARPPRIPRPVNLANVIATLPGSRPGSAGRIYVVCAHYDSRAKNILDATSPAPGADDNASGVAAVLEMARVMSKYDFGATLVFMALAGEEQGLVGSTHWAEQARKMSLDVAAVLNNDTIGNSHTADGRVDRHSVRLFAQGVPPTAEPGEALLQLIRTGGENDTPARSLARAIRDIAEIYVPSMTVRIIYRGDRYLGEGDQLPFLDRGYPAVRFTEPTEDFRHQREDVRTENGVAYGDTPDFVDYVYVSEVTRLNTAALAALARAPAAPRAVQVETARPENDTTLRWASNTEPDLAGYRIVWRETTAPFWEHALDVAKDVTRATVPGVAKDNVYFGVEAFDSGGHLSRAVYPLPSSER